MVVQLNEYFGVVPTIEIVKAKYGRQVDRGQIRVPWKILLTIDSFINKVCND